MRKFASLMLMLLAPVLLGQHGVQAGPLGVAGDYNVFVFGDIEQWGTDIEGRVAAGGIATYGRDGVGQGFAIASRLKDDPTDNLVAGNSVILKNGSIGYFDPNAPGGSGDPSFQKGNIAYGGPTAPDIAVNVGYNPPPENRNLVDFFANAKSYLTALSDKLGNLIPNGTTDFLKNALNETFEIDLIGSDPNLNIFKMNADDITQNLKFKFFAPENSTILVNIIGSSAVLKNFEFYFNSDPGRDPLNEVKGEDEDAQNQPFHPPGYPYSNILFNFLDAMNIEINNIAIDGSILAPKANIDFGEESHIDGNLIAASLFGQGEAHNRPFNGNFPVAVPEPSTLLLLAVGLLGMLARRRGK